MTMQSECCRSPGNVVAPPRPNDVPSAATVELWHNRAWFSIWTTPRGVGVALDLDDLAVLDVDVLAAAHRAVGTDGLDDAIGVRRPGAQLARSLGLHRGAAAGGVAVAELAQQGPVGYPVAHRAACTRRPRRRSTIGYKDVLSG
jgi:hypothetical protein